MLVAIGSYAGTGSAQTPVSGLAFTPEVVIVKGQSGQIAQVKTTSMGSNNSKSLTGNNAIQTDQITALNSDGFSVGTGSRANQNSATYHYIALADGGHGDLVVGSYTGTGSVHTEAVVGFPADLVVILGATAVSAVLRTSLHTGNNSQTFIGGPNANGITALTATGFTLSTNANVNTNGTTYHFFALKQRTATFEVFSYLGNGPVDDYNVDSVTTMQPGAIFVKAQGAFAAIMRTSEHVGDLSVAVSAVTAAANQIQAFRPTGIQVGTDTTVNGASSVTFHGLAFATPSGLTRVSTTRSFTWRVRDRVNATRSLTWRVRDRVSTTRSLTWRVRDRVSTTRSLTWHVRDRLTATRAFAWIVRDRQSATRSLTWRVRARALTTRSFTWRLRARVSSTRSFSWAIRMRDSAARSLTWAIGDQIVRQFSTRSFTWQVRERRSTTRAFQWNLRDRRTTTRSLTWQIRLRQMASRSLTWDIRLRQNAARSFAWALRQRSSDTRTFTWELRGRASALRTFTWDVLGETIPPPVLIGVRYVSRMLVSGGTRVRGIAESRIRARLTADGRTRSRSTGVDE